MSERTFRDVLRDIDGRAQSKREKGDGFEELVKAFLERDRVQSDRFANVWLWDDWPGNGGRVDTGVDIVAEERDGGGLVAIQCKFYSEDNSIALDDLNKLLAAYGTIQFDSGIMVTTTEKWTRNADGAIKEAHTKPIVRWGPDVFENSSFDWNAFDIDNPYNAIQRPTKTLRDYQQKALGSVIAGFKENDRGKLIMACGTGKTLTALRIAEQQAGADGNVLFLTPSISLLSQSLLDWANDADVPLKTFAVCSDTKVGKKADDDEDISPYDLRDTPSTNTDHLVTRYKAAKRDGRMTVIFSTYQSLDVVSEAQKKGLPKFDLIICDEAHRTTGVSLQGEPKSASSFQRVHDNTFIKADKRLYMTATPRIYGDRAKQKANENRLTLASMDNEDVYGPELHRLGFGKAVELGILSPYKVVIFNVDQEQVGIDLDHLLSDSASPINLDNAAKMVGCWNGLGKRGISGLDFTSDPSPAKRAVAFSNLIEQSKTFAGHFPKVTEGCIKAAGAGANNLLQCEAQHVDGTQNALERSNHLAWLREEPEDGVCKILSNARCLTEGIDVPALDAILFLHPRKSDIDVVQAVGRVMRKAEGKKFGYIILPIAQAPNATAEETITDSAYQAVWQIINAISAHDDRFEAQINQLALTYDKPKPDYTEKTDIGTGETQHRTDDDEYTQGTLPLLIAGSAELRDAILAKVVDKHADPGYWQKWATDVREIAQRHEARIRALLNRPDSDVRPVFDNFLAGIRHSLNDGITEDDAIGMLSQHLVSKPVFDALFESYDFAQHNPVSQAMQATLESLQERGLKKETEGLDSFYRDVRVCVQGITDAASKQKVIAELYQKFFKLALPETAAKLGIVYTPVEVMDYIIRSVEDVLNREFNASVSDECVHIIDPFVGTGTFITRLLRSGLIRPEDLKRKYESELHANEIMLLAYYVAAVNIESTYQDVAEATEYKPFEGIVLTDTFQAYEEGAPMDSVLFPNNNERIERQKGLDIRVVMGNPPWSATNNREYPTIDGRVKQQYAIPSTAGHLSALYDPYVKAIRLASDRVQNSENGGIVAFVTNGGFIDSNAFDGFRKAVAKEFHAVYCFNLRGDARTSGEQRQKEGGGIFDSGSRAGVSILVLVKKPGLPAGATIYYRDIGDYLTREQKLDIVGKSSLANTEWEVITPNEQGDWIGQRHAAFATFRPLAADNTGDGPAPIFGLSMQGLKTNRDSWCFNSSLQRLQINIRNSVEFYNERVKAFQDTNPTGKVSERVGQAKEFAGNTPKQFHWDAKNYQHLAIGRTYQVDDADFRTCAYRPFFKQHLYFNRHLNNSIRRFPEIYPTFDTQTPGISLSAAGANAPFSALVTDIIPDWHLTGDTVSHARSLYNIRTYPPPVANLGIYLTGPGSSVPFSALMTDSITDGGLTSGNGASPYLARYRYVRPKPTFGGGFDDAGDAELERVSNINPAAVTEFRVYYSDNSITDNDLFFYTYGILHSEQYRQAFADDLQKQAARIPMAATADDFRAFADAGRELADLHVNYETVEPYPLEEIHTPDFNPDAPGAYRIEKMAYAGTARKPDKSAIICNSRITLRSIPAQAHEYRLGSRSALDWLIERYRVKTDSKSGIVNDPNDWATEHDDPRYIVDLVKRVTAVSLRTVEIVNGLPWLEFGDGPEP